MRRLSPETLLSGRYRILALAGVGGMGVVYRARDEELGVEVALKVLRPDLGDDPQMLDRFRSELVLARQVTHRNVVRIHDIGEHEGLRFLTMRFIEGRSLREILEKEGPLPVERAVPIARQIAEALDQAHEAGVVHRDLKPGNVLVGPDGTAFITDFGVARSLAGNGQTRAGVVVGTPDYLSPEQIAGDPVDGRTDLYALGIVLFEMLSGELPFQGGSQSEMLGQRLAGRPRDLSDAGVRAPAAVRAVIRRCLERSPARRYPSARALVEDLDRLDKASPRVPLLLLAALLLLSAVAWVLVRTGQGLPVLPIRGRDGRATAASPASARHAVAVLPLSDETAEPGLAWMDTGVAELLAASLSASPALRVLDELRVLRGLKDLRVPYGQYDERILRQVAELWGADRLVTGTVRRAGARFRVDLRLFEVGPDGSLTARSLGEDTAGPEGIFRLVSGLGERLRRELGSAPAAAAPLEPGTRSLAAARSYEEGRARLLVGDDVGAAPLLERAVEADRGFALALESLSETYQNLGFHDKAIAAAERASKAVGSSPSRLGYRVRARLALLRGSPAEAEKQYRDLLRRYPFDSEPRLDLAAAQAAQGHNAEAVETLREALANDPNDPRAWFLLGKNANLMGDSARAVSDYLVRALALQTRLGNEKGKADVLNAIGVAYQQLGDNPKALENYTAASALRRKLSDERGVAATLRNRALVFNAMGRPSEAETDFRAARAIFEKIGDRTGVSDVANDFGLLHEGRGDYAKALEAYQQGLKIRRGLGDERLLAQSYDNVGYIYYLLGEYDNALVYWQPALDLRRRIGERSGVVLSVQNLGFLQLAQGKWDEAVKSFVEALERSREIDFKNAIAISLGNLGMLYQYRGRYPAALESFGEAVEVSRRLEFKPALTEFTLKEARARLELGQLDAVAERVGQAEKWIEQTGNREQAADLEVLRGDWHRARGEREAARRAFSRAVELAGQSGSKVSLLHARIVAAASAAAPSPVSLGKLLSEAEGLGHALLTIESAEALSRAELSLGRAPAARASAHRALEAAQACGYGAGLWRLHALAGRVAEESGDRTAAAEAFRRSSAELQRLREGLPAELRARFDALPAVKQVLERRLEAESRKPEAGGTP
jgi:tetratricopeptide (TPR) repeat protein/TolB-like protein